MSSDQNKGIRGSRTTAAFRVINFELFAKPNKKVMLIGGACFAGCLTFLIFLNLSHDRAKPNRSTQQNSIITRWEK